MCGFVGSLAAPSAVSREAIEHATALLAHRGPDDSGVMCTSAPGLEIMLGARRLAILDLSPAGHQPMNDPETGNWIAYNGEVYNFREIRRRLESQGVVFRSQTDTEVVLKAYGQWGQDCVRQFRGMFAFAIWDAHRKELFLARDHFGKKPLYYSRAEKRIVFASEVRALVGSGLVAAKLNPAGLLDFLSFGSACDPRTCVAGVESLPMAHYMVVSEKGARLQRYWDLTSASMAASGTNLPGLLDEAMTLRLISDVRLGVFLSGGIDSSVVTGVLSRQRGGDFSTVSLVFPERRYSERAYARAVARHFRTDHHEVVINQRDVLETLPTIIRAMDQPSIDGVNTYVVSREARRIGLKVALSGLGGDELFGGYRGFRRIPRLERTLWLATGLPQRARTATAHVLRACARGGAAHKLAAMIGGEIPHPYLALRTLFTPGEQAALLRERGNALDGSRGMHSVLESLCLDPVNRVSYLELHHYLVNTLLRDTDGMSMAHGLEVRAPLLDHKLAESLFAIPGAAKLNSKTPKHLLLSAARVQLPAQVVYRPKRGFAFPFEGWFRDEFRDEIERVLLHDDTLTDYLDANAVRWVWRRFQEGRTTWARPWALYVAKKWAAAVLS